MSRTLASCLLTRLEVYVYSLLCVNAYMHRSRLFEWVGFCLLRSFGFHWSPGSGLYAGSSPELQPDQWGTLSRRGRPDPELGDPRLRHIRRHLSQVRWVLEAAWMYLPRIPSCLPLLKHACIPLFISSYKVLLHSLSAQLSRSRSVSLLCLSVNGLCSRPVSVQ